MDWFRRAAALSLALLFDACMILVLVPKGQTTGEAAQATMVWLLHPEAAVRQELPAELPVSLEKVSAPSLVPPAIRVESIDPARATAADASLQESRVPPLLDSRAPNNSPAIPIDLERRLMPGEAYVVIVRALVLENGLAGDAQVAASSGFREMDDLAAAEVRAHWRFIPATENGKLVRDWVSVEVLFKT